MFRHKSQYLVSIVVGLIAVQATPHGECQACALGFQTGADPDDPTLVRIHLVL